MIEIWKDVVGYEGYYEVSNTAKIRNVISRHILKPGVSGNGYLLVVLTKGFIKKSMWLHIIVAKAHVPNQNSLPIVNHKNGIKLNCFADNLEWSTQAKNIQHALETGLIITDSVVQESLTDLPIMVFRDSAHARRMLGIEVKQGSNGIRNCCKGTQQTAYGYKWRYYNATTDSSLPNAK